MEQASFKVESYKVIKYNNIMQKGSLRTKKLFIFILMLSFFSFLFIPKEITHAQVQGTDIVLSISPEYPNPGQTVTATLTSYVVNLNKANVAWYINGENIATGIGKNTFSFTLNSLGTTTNITANIELVRGQTLTKSLLINSSDVDMLWEAVDSYVPPFYKGKALVSKEGVFKVVAIPNMTQGGIKINPNNLSYNWTKDNKGQPAFSGWSKSFYTFTNSYLEATNQVTVKVSDISGTTTTEGRITLRPTDPKIIFYKKDPDLGIIRQKSLESEIFIEKEGAVIVAVPYFFSPKDLSASVLNFQWTIGNNRISTPSIKNEIYVKGATGESGSTTISLLVENTRTLFQNLGKKINVNF